MPTSAAQLEHVADDLKSWVRKLADDAEESQWIRLSDAQVPCTHPSFPCASLHIPRLSVSQCVFVAFCRARGLNPTKTQGDKAFKKWATENDPKLRLSTDENLPWKVRPTSKIKCAAAPPCTRPRPPAPPPPRSPTRPAAGDRNLGFDRAPTTMPLHLSTYREGFVGLGVLPAGTGADWKGAFTMAQWEALLEKGKARLPSCPDTPAASPPHSAFARQLLIPLASRATGFDGAFCSRRPFSQPHRRRRHRRRRLAEPVGGRVAAVGGAGRAASGRDAAGRVGAPAASTRDAGRAFSAVALPPFHPRHAAAVGGAARAASGGDAAAVGGAPGASTRDAGRALSAAASPFLHRRGWLLPNAKTFYKKPNQVQQNAKITRNVESMPNSRMRS